MNIKLIFFYTLRVLVNPKACDAKRVSEEKSINTKIATVERKTIAMEQWLQNEGG
jgi:hypothetical protein